MLFRTSYYIIFISCKRFSTNAVWENKIKLFDDNSDPAFLDIECRKRASIDWLSLGKWTDVLPFPPDPRSLDFSGEWWWATADGFRKWKFLQCMLSEKNGCFAWNAHFVFASEKKNCPLVLKIYASECTPRKSTLCKLVVQSV